jgi:hypothetical protein
VVHLFTIHAQAMLNAACKMQGVPCGKMRMETRTL